MLAPEHDVVARYNGGPNAGHTVILPDGRELDLHGIPSGIAHDGIMNVVGNGVYLDPIRLNEEIADIEDIGIDVTTENLKISSAAHLIMPHHISADEIRESGSSRQGSTKSGIAQVAADKFLRVGIRAEIIKNRPDKLLEVAYQGLIAQRHLRAEERLPIENEHAVAKHYVNCAKRLGKYITDTTFYLNRRLRDDKPARVLAEGAQAFLLDIDHGMYPYTTSSSPTSGGVTAGLGVPSKFINRVIGVAKAVQSHVGDGPFVTEIFDKDLLGRLHGDMSAVDAEKGTTTGRVRRLGYLDLPQIRRSHYVSEPDEQGITKVDWVPRFGEQIPVCIAYKRKGKTLYIAPDAAYKLEESEPMLEYLENWEEDIQEVRNFNDLPKNAQTYIEFIEDQTGVPITMVGVGPRRDQVILRHR